MSNILYSKRRLFQFKVPSFINIYISFLYYDDYLVLKNPKLIKLLNRRMIDSVSVFPFHPILKTKANNLVDNINAFDKKQRDLPIEQNFAKSKKLKNKPIKNKFRSSSDIKDEKLFKNRSHDTFSQDLLDRSLNKSRKQNLRNKKRYKTKITVLNNNDLSDGSLISENTLNSNNLHRSINIAKNLTIQELSTQISVHEAEIITYLFLNKGISATVNQMLNQDIIRDIADYYKVSIAELPENQDALDYLPQKVKHSPNSIRRSPIITILGHVDHGKTTLLDVILKTNLKSQESGGITQAITGYEILYNHGSQNSLLIFLDTPGHQSFKEMRLRGAKVTDIVLLVIATNDGVKPQTIEAISYIREMKLSCIVVLTKCDEPINHVEKIKKDLSTYGLLCTEWGGDIKVIEVSALKKYNIDVLLSAIHSLAEVKNLVADPKAYAVGTILESYLDKKQGITVNLIIQNGTLKIGDIICVKDCCGKVKSILNIKGSKLKSSGPSSIVQVLAFNSLPQVGSLFSVFENEKIANKSALRCSNVSQINNTLKSLDTRITLNALSDSKQLEIILKTNTQGMLEATLDLLSTISQSKVQINVISAGCGSISNKDIELAATTNAIIIGFDVNVLPQINNLLKKSQIIFKVFHIIYDLFDYVESLMLSLVEPEYDKVLIGSAIVQTVFNMNQGSVAGCVVDQGKLNIKSYIHVYRNKSLVYSGYISSLKHIKNNVQEVIFPNECGLMTSFESWQTNDVIKAYDLVSKKKTL